MSWRRRGAPGAARSCGRCGTSGRRKPPAVTMCDNCHTPLCEKHMVWNDDAFWCRRCMEDPQQRTAG